MEEILEIQKELTVEVIDRITTNYAKTIAVLEKSIKNIEGILKMQKELLEELEFKPDKA